MNVGKHILVVDHDGDVRQVIADLLLDLGYRVSLAKDPAAMRAFLDTPDLVDLLVIDASTSEEGTIALAVTARERGIRVVMISGHPEIMERYHKRVDQLLHKPFRQDELSLAIDYALSSIVRGQRSEDPE